MATAQTLSGESGAGTVVLLSRAVLTAIAIVALARAFVIAQPMSTAVCRADLLVASSTAPAELAAAGATQAFAVAAAIDGIALTDVARRTTPRLRAKTFGRLADAAS